MSKKAFTLIEMLVAIFIVGIISTFVVIQTNGAINAAKDTQRKSDIQLLANAVTQYSSENYSSKPITDGNGCTINGGTDPCSTTIEDSLKAYLPTLPDDPNTAASYVYQSDGNNCTISASLSDGTTYQYSCTNDAMTTGTPTDGVCGSAQASYYPTETAFTGTFCTSGTLVSEPTFPTVQGTEVSWQCAGEYLGSSTTCTAQLGKDGQCGTAIRSTTNAYTPTESFSTDYCATGTVATTPTDPAQGGSTTWQCPPLYKGTTADCVAYRGKDGQCGSSNGGNYYLSSEVTNTCSTGSLIGSVTGSGDATGYFDWSCSPLYSGSNASCTANLKEDGVCGTAERTYSYSETSFGSYTYCSKGTFAAETSPFSFPSMGSYTYWSCVGKNSGTSDFCSASRPCPAIETTVSGTTCPTGYNVVAYHFPPATCTGSCNDYMGYACGTGNQCPSYDYYGWSGRSCTTVEAWSTTSPTCSYYSIYRAPGMDCSFEGSSVSSCSANPTQVKCVLATSCSSSGDKTVSGTTCPTGYHALVYHFPPATCTGSCNDYMSYACGTGDQCPSYNSTGWSTKSCTTVEAWSTTSPTCDYRSIYRGPGMDCNFEGSSISSCSSNPDQVRCIQD